MKIAVACSLVLAIGCEPEPAPEPPPPPRWAYSPSTPTLPMGPVRGRIGRSQSPQLVPPVGIVGFPREPVRQPTPWQVPGDGPGRAVVVGAVAGGMAVELIDIDAGNVAWRDTTVCAGTVVGVTEKVVVCAGGNGVQALALDGKPAWTTPDAFIAMTDDRVVVASPRGDSVASLRDAATGGEVASMKLPAGVVATAIAATCGEHELFAFAADGKLQRVVDAKVVWAVPMGAVLSIDACAGDSIVIAEPGGVGTSLVALARATGKPTGRVDGVRGWWPARGDVARIEIATADGVASWSRDLAAAQPLELPPLGELLAKRGDRRLVRATPRAAVLLDRTGVKAYVELASAGAALGDGALVASSWLGSPGETVHRVGLPSARWRGELRDNAPRRGLAIPAELRDLPTTAPVDGASGIVRADTAMRAVVDAAIDGDQLYVVPLERAPDDTNGGGVARMDLVERGVRWLRPDGCGPGMPISIALARDVVVCAARNGHAIIRATSRAGAPSWDVRRDNVDRLLAAGDVIVAFDADRMTALDAHDGRVLGTIASDDASPVRAAVVELDGTTWLFTYERGRLVARIPQAALVSVWSIAVDGIVASIAAGHDGVVVGLDDGDAYVVDPRTAAVTAIPGVGLRWQPSQELVMGATAGGPLYGPVPPAPPPRPPMPVTGPPPTFSPPPFAMPVPTPPPIGASWQLAIYEANGAFRVRNDYELAGRVVPAPLRGAAASPLVVGFGQHEALVIDPASGDPLRRAQLPPDDGIAFSTIVDGRPVAGIVLASPLRVVLF